MKKLQCKKVLCILMTLCLLLGLNKTSLLATTVKADSTSDTVTLNFQLYVEQGIPEDNYVTITSSINNWSVSDPDWQTTKIDANHFELTLDVPASHLGTTIAYKWMMQDPNDANASGWEYVECDEQGKGLEYRVMNITSESNTVSDETYQFSNPRAQSSLTGTLETFKLDMPQFDYDHQRSIWVWLPEGYDANNTCKTYPVLYMMDGENLFDNLNCSFGEWGVDEAMTKLIEEEGYEEAIVVGIGNGCAEGDYDVRMNELSPNWTRNDIGAPYITNAQGDKFAAFVTETVRPYINSHYNTKSSRGYTGVGGSSMGGIMAFYLSMEYPDIYGYSLVFSPALQIYEEGTIENYIESKHVSDMCKKPYIYLYSGGTCLCTAEANSPYDESMIAPFVGIIYNKLLSEGYPCYKMNTLVIDEYRHAESYWGAVFPTVYTWATRRSYYFN